ncbi:MAG: Rieske (2Fe-2S) protein [Alphaproteobacteria bacterium]|nr:Rieske (2Fe-2S) protein [Alphaproteobacteria bacterium]
MAGPFVSERSMTINLPATDVTDEKPARVKTAAGFEIAVFRHGEEYFAVANRCPHQGASLAEGHCDGEDVVCPMHRFKYDPRSGRCRFPKHLRLRVFPITKTGDTLAIDDSMAPDPAAGQHG